MTSQTLHLRAATEEDAPELQRLEAACFGEAWSLKLLLDVLRDPKYLLLCAEDAGGLLGYAAAWSVLDEGQIDRLAVLPSQRRRGLGRALLGGIVERLRDVGAEKVLLEVRADNVAAIELYRGAGFKAVGRTRRYYHDGTDAILMRLGGGE